MYPSTYDVQCQVPTEWDPVTLVNLICIFQWNLSLPRLKNLKTRGIRVEGKQIQETKEKDVKMMVVKSQHVHI